jgi:hypothetical protein
MAKFTTIDLSAHFAASATGGAAAWHPDIGEALKTLPAGQQTFWGIPFALGVAEDGERWLVLNREPEVIEIAARARYVVVAHFCNISPLPADPDALKLTVLRVIPQPGEHLADYVLVYADGSEHRQPIRRRFEVNEAVTNWGQDAFAARPHQQPIPLDFRGPIPPGAWGGFQTEVGSASQEPASYWLYALENPYPDKVIRAIRLEPAGADCLAVAAITLYEGQEHPPAPAPAGVAARHAAGRDDAGRPGDGGGPGDHRPQVRRARLRAGGMARRAGGRLGRGADAAGTDPSGDP